MTNAQTPGTINPADGSSLDPVAGVSQDDVLAAVARSREAQSAWAAKSFDARATAVRAFTRRALERIGEGGEIMSSETGRSPTESMLNDMAGLGPMTETIVKVGRSALRPEKLALSALEYPGKKGVIEMVPRGVIGIIAPWNYPFGNFIKHLLPALLAGNGIVLKPSEHTPRTGAFLQEVCDETLPKGLVNLVQGDGRVGAWLLESGVDAITFTGSVPTGKKVASRAGELLIPASVELGGKDAAIVLADCNLGRTALGIAQWGMHNCGQNCAGIERVYVEEAIADEFVKKLGAIVGKLRVAPTEGSDIGPLQNQAQLKIVESHVSAAQEQGAELIAGGKKTGSGFGYHPTVLDHCSSDMTVVNEETFGPVLAVIRVADAEDAIKQANASEYGLNGSVWTTNLVRGEAIARRLEVGVALVNNHAVTGTLPQAAWTGVKATGPGVALSRHAYLTYARPRTVLVDKNSGPDPFWFPMNEDLRAFVDALVERSLGSFGATFKLIGILGRRAKASKELADSE